MTDVQWLAACVGIWMVGIGVWLLVLAARRARADRIRRARIAARTGVYRSGVARVSWPAGQPPVGRGRVYGTPRRDGDETAVMPRGVGRV